MLKSYKSEDLSLEKLQVIKKYFEKGTLFKDLVELVQDWAIKNDIDSDIIRLIKTLMLEEEFLEKILSNARLKDQIIAPSRQIDQHVYYIFEGYVNVFDSSSDQLINLLRQGQTFKLDSKITQKRKYKCLDPNDPDHLQNLKQLKLPTTSISSASLLQFDLNHLLEVFIT